MNIQSINVVPQELGRTEPAPVAPVQPVTLSPDAGRQDLAAPQPEKSAPPKPEAVKEAVRGVNEALRMLSRSIEFSVDEDTGRQLVKVVDQETKQVLRQIPSEEMLAIAKGLDRLVGLLIRDKA
ncbi:flagellar protein FlaG [Thermithiobacillus plumbiphilus]|uniref:Flagellar protein FlaG n=1 Tax=Thermithiobacillus plumbiphilus TaxID=1729899 RepID=A0ABU9DCV9_9PROT